LEVELKIFEDIDKWKAFIDYSYVTSSSRSRMGLPTFPSCYAYIASASGRVLLKATGRFLLHKGNLPSSVALSADLGRGLPLHRPSRVAPPHILRRSMRLKNINLSALIYTLTHGDFSPIELSIIW